jgi:phosphatidylglycerophosphatase A
MASRRQFPASALRSPAVWLATGLGVGLVAGIGWQIAAVVVLNAVGVLLCTAAGRALGGQKDHQAIVWDEIATIPVVFLFVPMTSWPVVLVGFLLHRAWDITKTPLARQLERLPDGWGVMADDWLAGAYAGVSLWVIVWITHAAGWSGLSSSGG